MYDACDVPKHCHPIEIAIDQQNDQHTLPSPIDLIQLMHNHIHLSNDSKVKYRKIAFTCSWLEYRRSTHWYHLDDHTWTVNNDAAASCWHSIQLSDCHLYNNNARSLRSQQGQQRLIAMKLMNDYTIEIDIWCTGSWVWITSIHPCPLSTRHIELPDIITIPISTAWAENVATIQASSPSMNTASVTCQRMVCTYPMSHMLLSALIHATWPYRPPGCALAVYISSSCIHHEPDTGRIADDGAPTEVPIVAG